MPNIQVYTEARYETMRELHRFRTRKIQVAAGFAGALFCTWAFRHSYRELWPDITPMLPYVGISLLIAALFVALMYYGYSKRTHLRSAGTLPEGWTYTFGEESFTVQADDKEPSEFRYDSLLKVGETKHLILLYNSRMSSLPVDKNGMREGTLDDLRALLKAKLPADKYKLK